ncbi:MAG: twin-arginine translocation signal domain-containing protein [Alphaproteobacteria bacterium]|nr:twin-arginine translocation signal domain-containing protein [Alphaproteobacteria bacterium]
MSITRRTFLQTTIAAAGASALPASAAVPTAAPAARVILDAAKVLVDYNGSVAAFEMALRESENAWLHHKPFVPGVSMAEPYTPLAIAFVGATECTDEERAVAQAQVQANIAKLETVFAEAAKASALARQLFDEELCPDSALAQLEKLRKKCYLKIFDLVIRRPDFLQNLAFKQQKDNILASIASGNVADMGVA